MLKAIIFDMDGVLINSHGAHRAAWRRFNEAVQNPITERDLDFVLDGRKREEILFHFLGSLSPQQLEEYGRLKDGFFDERMDEIEVVTGIHEFLHSVRQNSVPMAVATSASTQRTHNMLIRLRLDGFFPVVVTGTEVVNGKPDPSVFLLAAERMGVPPAEVLVFEDAVAGVKAALDAGMRCIGVTAPERAGALLRSGAERVISDFVGLTFSDLGRWLNERPSQLPLARVTP